MNPRHRVLFTASSVLALVALVQPSLTSGQSRTWTSQDGTTVKAELVDYTETTLHLKRDDNGAVVEVSLDQLSKADQAFALIAKRRLDRERAAQRSEPRSDEREAAQNQKQATNTPLPRYEVVELGTLRGFEEESKATDINDHGVVVGICWKNERRQSQAFIWKDGTLAKLDVPGFPIAVNNRGDVLSNETIVTPRTHFTRAYLTVDGASYLLKVDANDEKDSPGCSLNNQGVAVVLNGFESDLWSIIDGTPSRETPKTEDSDERRYSLRRVLDDGSGVGVSALGGRRQACIYQSGEWFLLDTPEGYWSNVQAQNQRGDLAGFISGSASWSKSRRGAIGNFAVLWPEGSAMVRLGALDDDIESSARDISPDGTVIGSSWRYKRPRRQPRDQVSRPFIWTQEHGMLDPHDLLIDQQRYEWKLIRLSAINAHNQIVGVGSKLDGPERAILLNPVDENGKRIASRPKSER